MRSFTSSGDASGVASALRAAESATPKSTSRSGTAVWHGPITSERSTRKAVALAHPARTSAHRRLWPIRIDIAGALSGDASCEDWTLARGHREWRAAFDVPMKSITLLDRLLGL